MTLPFELKVYVFTRPNMRDEGLNMETYLGDRVLRACFDTMTPFADESLFLSFPERRTNLVEQRALLGRLARYGTNLKKVTIKTHSVFIIQTTPNKSCFVFDDGGRRIQETGEGKLYVEGPMPLQVIPSDGSLAVL